MLIFAQEIETRIAFFFIMPKKGIFNNKTGFWHKK